MSDEPFDDTVTIERYQLALLVIAATRHACTMPRPAAGYIATIVTALAGGFTPEVRSHLLEIVANCPLETKGEWRQLIATCEEGTP